MATATIGLCSNNFGGYCELVYDDVTLVVAGIHVVNPPGGVLTSVHILMTPNRKIDQQFPGGTDQSFSLGPNQKIVWITNRKGELAPSMPWLLEFALSVDGS